MRVSHALGYIKIAKHAGERNKQRMIEAGIERIRHRHTDTATQTPPHRHRHTDTATQTPPHKHTEGRRRKQQNMLVASSCENKYILTADI